MLEADRGNRLKKPQSYISIVESEERNLDVIEFTTYDAAIILDPSSYLKKLLDKF
jgi:hypothetical protein